MSESSRSLRWVAFVVFLAQASACAGPNQDATVLPLEGAEAQPEPGLRVTEFVFGPGDELKIDVFRNRELTRDVRILPDGTFSYPLLGEVQAAGLGVKELRERITEGLRPYLVVEPKVSIEITALKSRKVAVLGEVRRPGIFSLEHSLSAIEAVTAAGGFTKEATQSSVLLVRANGGQLVAKELDISGAIVEGELGQNALLKPGDVLYIPTSIMADVDRIVGRLAAIMGTLVLAETGIILGPQVKDILQGKPIGSTAPPIAIVPQ